MPFLLFVSSGGSEQDLESVLRRIFFQRWFRIRESTCEISHRIPMGCFRYISLHEWLIFHGFHVGKYTVGDPMGYRDLSGN